MGHLGGRVVTPTLLYARNCARSHGFFEPAAQAGDLAPPLLARRAQKDRRPQILGAPGYAYTLVCENLRAQHQDSLPRSGNGASGFDAEAEFAAQPGPGVDPLPIRAAG